MRASIFMFASDLCDEGFDVVLGRVARAGLDGVTLACAYHHARDVFPHNPASRVRFLEGGAVFFRPDPTRFHDLLIQPHVSQLAKQHDVLARVMEETAASGRVVRAWTVFLHNTTLGSRYPNCVIRNAFGDPYVTSLCPANPDVRAYACALAADIARHGVESILAESLAFAPFDHGYHHERSFVPLSPLMRFLLGLCFCEHCLAAAGAGGVDGDKLRAGVRQLLDGAIARGAEVPGTVELSGLSAMFDGLLGQYLAAREAIVTSLVAEVTQAVGQASSTRVIFMDMSGATKGYATGRPTGEPAPAIAWQDGVDVAAVGSACHGIEAIGYAADPERLRVDLDAYRGLLPGGVSLSAAMRPMSPDCEGPGNLRDKLTVAREIGLDWVDFYHYGFMPLDRLEWIRDAIAKS